MGSIVSAVPWPSSERLDGPVLFAAAADARPEPRSSAISGWLGVRGSLSTGGSRIRTLGPPASSIPYPLTTKSEIVHQAKSG